MKSLSRLNGDAGAGVPSGDMAGLCFDEWRTGVTEGAWCVGTGFKAERAWSLWKANNVAHAEINGHLIGYEVRVYLNGNCGICLAAPTREQAKVDAEGLKQAGLEDGWTDRPPLPDE